MSRKKLVSYIRPEEPKFLRELKEQIKYKEGPTINTKMDKKRIRLVFLYEYKLGHKAVETTRNINHVFGKNTVNEFTVKRWFTKFQNGNENIEDESLEDEEDCQLFSVIKNDQLKKTLIKTDSYTMARQFGQVKEILPRISDNEEEDIDGEKPLVVVLNSGDLTAEEAEAYEKQKQKEEAEAPIDLSKRVIFNKDKLKKRHRDTIDGSANKKVKKSKHKKAVLSFNDEEEESLG